MHSLVQLERGGCTWPHSDTPSTLSPTTVCSPKFLHLAYFQDEKQAKCHSFSPTPQIPSAYSGFFSRGPNNVLPSGLFLLPLIPNCTGPQLSCLELFSQEDRQEDRHQLLTDRRTRPVSFCLCLFPAPCPSPAVYSDTGGAFLKAIRGSCSHLLRGT